jgi:integrase
VVRYFQSLKDAERFCSRVFQEGSAALKDIKQTEATLVAMAKATFDGDITKIFDAIEFYRRTKLRSADIEVREAAERFIEHQKSEGRKRLTLVDDRTRLRQLCIAMGHLKVGDITDHDLRAWLKTFKPGATRQSMHKALHKFFRWMKREHIIALDPMDEITPMDEWGRRTAIIPVKDFRTLLEVCASKKEFPVRVGDQKRPQKTEFSDLLPFFALAGFAGIRTKELVRRYPEDESLRWEDIQWDRRFIHIRSNVAKSTRRSNDERYISNDLTIDALNAWLRPIAQAEGYVIPYKTQKFMERKTAFLKMLALRLPENGLRNSFASYFMTARSEAGAGELSREMGNSETIAKSFYIRALEPRTGKEWFDCRP